MQPKNAFDIYALADVYRKREPHTLTADEKNIINVADATLMDDIFMSEVFRDDCEGVTYILRIILERDDLTVERVTTQHDIDSAFKRSIRLDIRAVDTQKNVYDIELQRTNDGAIPRRARFYSSKLDHDLLEKNEDFSQLVDTYVIFITDNDIFKAGLPVYRISRRIENLSYTAFNDGAHIVYVNGAYREDTPIGNLMADFHCTKAEQMHSPLLAKRLHAVKGNEERSIHMGLNSRDFYNQGLSAGKENGQKEIIFSMFSKKMYSDEMISDLTALPLGDIIRYRKEYTVQKQEQS